tara:strand:+ start:408 stop:512 length:105 start_codon:yes stop_codon:yes gene_type:complete
MIEIAGIFKAKPVGTLIVANMQLKIRTEKKGILL